jgi:hypothetical protein
MSVLLLSPYSYKALPATLQTFSIPPVAEKTLSVKNNICLILYFFIDYFTRRFGKSPQKMITYKMVVVTVFCFAKANKINRLGADRGTVCFF